MAEQQFLTYIVNNGIATTNGAYILPFNDRPLRILKAKNLGNLPLKGSSGLINLFEVYLLGEDEPIVFDRDFINEFTDEDKGKLSPVTTYTIANGRVYVADTILVGAEVLRGAIEVPGVTVNKDTLVKTTSPFEIVITLTDYIILTGGEVTTTTTTEPNKPCVTVGYELENVTERLQRFTFTTCKGLEEDFLDSMFKMVVCSTTEPIPENPSSFRITKLGDICK
jgi:hypothetical protein